MRKVIFMMHVSLDGLVAGPNGEMDWIVYTNELEAYGHVLHRTTDAAIYGRVTFQMMEGYWPTVLENPAEQTQGAMNHARWADAATKVVVSRTLHQSPWRNTIFVKDDVVTQIEHMKRQPGKDMWLLGSPSVAQLFMQHGLIDEYWLNINPVILGNGKPLFGELATKLNLKLLEVKTIEGGVVALRYAPERK